MPTGKSLKRLVAHQHRRVPRQAQRLASESVFLRRFYFLNPERSKYVCLGFYPDRGTPSFS
jgi:hypothetical protein